MVGGGYQWSIHNVVDGSKTTMVRLVCKSYGDARIRETEKGVRSVMGIDGFQMEVSKVKVDMIKDDVARLLQVKV